MQFLLKLVLGAGSVAGDFFGGLSVKALAIGGAILFAALIVLGGYLYVSSITSRLAETTAKLAVERIQTATTKASLDQALLDQDRMKKTVETYERARATTEAEIQAASSNIETLKIGSDHVTDDDLRALNDASDGADRLFQSAGK